MEERQNRIADNNKQGDSATCAERDVGIEVHSPSECLSAIWLGAEITAVPVEILLELSNQMHFHSVTRGAEHARLVPVRERRFRSIGGER
jgi:hypothetical protein